VKPYTEIASLYDKIMSHVNYMAWYRLIQRISRKYFNNSQTIRLLELGCGTGSLGAILKQQGPYIGSDKSDSMLKVAQQKASAPFVCMDACYPAIKQQFDMIVFLYDGINYLTDYDTLCLFFKNIAPLLCSGGVLLFDVTTEYNSRRHFFDEKDFESFDTGCYLRHSYFDPLTHLQKNHFTFFYSIPSNQHLYHRSEELHTQRVYPVSQIESAINHSGFSIRGIWDGFSFRRYHSRSERIHILLQKDVA